MVALHSSLSWLPLALSCAEVHGCRWPWQEALCLPPPQPEWLCTEGCGSGDQKGLVPNSSIADPWAEPY